MTRSNMLSVLALLLLAAPIIPHAVISQPLHRHAAPGAIDACPNRCAASEPRGFCAIFAPGTPEDYVQRFQQRFSIEIAFAVVGRWTQTATNSSTGGNGTPITLTYGFVPDGVLAVPDGYVAPGVTSIDNKLFATMDAKFGSTAAWQNLFRDVFSEWSALTGVTLVEETADDGATWVISPGVLGVRADIRIVCIDEDGPNGVLAFNYYPNFGDMALDAAENWANSANDYRFLRNVVMHELGHGIGLAHVLPRDGTKLMEAFLALGYTGPQDDDVRGAGFSYGDPHESNGTAGAAADLGAFVSGAAFDDMALHSGGDVDWYSVSASPGTQIIARLLPRGAVYAVGPDPGSPTTIDTRAIHRLRLQVYDQDGVTLLSTHTAAVAGEGVFNPPVPVPVGDTGLLLRVSTPGGADDIQRYELTLLDSAGTPRALSLSSTPESGVVCGLTPADASGRATALTPFSLMYNNGQQVTVSAPQTFGGSSFARWRLDGAAQPAGQMSLTLTMSADRAAVAEYVPALSVNAGADRVIVPGESVQLDAVASNGTPPYEYSWTPPAGLSSAAIANPIAAPAQTTAYTAAVTDALGHVGIDTVVVSVAPPLSVDAGPDRAALAGQAVSLFVSVEGGEAPYSYDWSPPLSQPGAIMQVFTARVSQTTQFTLTVTDAGGRVASGTVTVQVIERLTVSAGPDVTIGPGQTASLVADVQGGLPPYTCGWRAGSGPTESHDLAFAVSPARTTTYTVTVSDAAGQRAEDSIVISVGAAFTAVATATPGAIARGGVSRLLAVASGGQHPYAYAWSPTAGLSAPTSAATDARPSETTTYRVVVTDATGRTAESAVELRVGEDGLVSPGLAVGPAGLCGFGALLALPAGLLGLGLAARQVRRGR